MNLSGLHPTQTYQYLVNTDSGKIYDGSGTQLTTLELTASYALYQVTWEVSSSYASSSTSASQCATASQLANNFTTNSIVISNGFGVTYNPSCSIERTNARTGDPGMTLKIGGSEIFNDVDEINVGAPQALYIVPSENSASMYLGRSGKGLLELNCSKITNGITGLKKLSVDTYIGLPYSSSTKELIPTVNTGSMYVDVTNNLIYVYTGDLWRSASLF